MTTSTTTTMPLEVPLTSSSNNNRPNVAVTYKKYLYSFYYHVPVEVIRTENLKLIPSLAKEQEVKTEPVCVDNLNRLVYDSNRMETDKMYTITWNNDKLGLMKRIKDGKPVVSLYEFEPDV